MTILDLGRRRGIGANCLFVELGPFRLLIDAGMDPKAEGLQATPDFSLIDDYSIDLIVLTHCHLDHLGALPLALRRNPTAQVLMTAGSMILAPRMLRNSVNVMKRQRDEAGLRELPLYGHAEIDHIEGQFCAMTYRQPRDFTKDGETLGVTFYRAGHIVGAAGFMLTWRHRSVFFTGDVLFGEQETLKGADFPTTSVDTLVMETTRGRTPRDPTRERSSEVERLLSTIENTLAGGGSVLIPVFALGRMQELMAIFFRRFIEGRRSLPKIFCSGLGLDLVNYFDAVARRTRMVNFRRSLIKDLKIERFAGELRPGRDLSVRGIYLVSSGMLVEHTPSYGIAASLLDHSRNSVCFVGYCDPDTPGGQLLECGRGDAFQFRKLDYVAKVQASIERFDLSGHADREELMDFALRLDPRAVVLTHGDPEAREWFQDQFAELTPSTVVHDPEVGESISV